MESTVLALAIAEVASLWFPPSIGSLKVNFDGAVFEAEGAIRVGMVIRAEWGIFVAGLSRKVLSPCVAQTAKILAAREATRFAIQRGCDGIFLKGDSSNVMKMLTNLDSEFDPLGSILADIRISLNIFRYYSVSTVRRTGNKVTHKLARHAINVDCVAVWEEEAPYFIMPLLLSDIPI